MEQKDRQLLIQALCALLPFGVKVELMPVTKGKCVTLRPVILQDYFISDDVNYLPYLRPMSSMTEEEKLNLYKLAGFYYLSDVELLKDEWRSFTDSIEDNKLFFPYPIWQDDLQKVYKYLNTNCYDYWGLIEKGLAIAVTKENNPYIKD